MTANPTVEPPKSGGLGHERGYTFTSSEVAGGLAGVVGGGEHGGARSPPLVVVVGQT